MSSGLCSNSSTQAVKTTISVVVPLLNEGHETLRLVSDLVESRQYVEVIVVDGSSPGRRLQDLARCQRPDLLESARLTCVPAMRCGRAIQMNQGAAVAGGEVLLFLHGDSRLPSDAGIMIERGLPNSEWGHFMVRLDDRRMIFRLVECLMNWRSRLTGIVTGDQCIFVRKTMFESLGGFADIPIMEDVELSKRLRRRSKPYCISRKALTSARRWQQQGILYTIVLMWRMRFLYWLGVDVDRLARLYRKRERSQLQSIHPH